MLVHVSEVTTDTKAHVASSLKIRSFSSFSTRRSLRSSCKTSPGSRGDREETWFPVSASMGNDCLASLQLLSCLFPGLFCLPFSQSMTRVDASYSARTEGFSLDSGNDDLVTVEGTQAMFKS